MAIRLLTTLVILCLTFRAGADWTSVKPESAGCLSVRLEALRGWLKTHLASATIVDVHGKSAFEPVSLKTPRGSKSC